MTQQEPAQKYSDFLRILRRSTDALVEDSVREEIFSVERLEQYAKYLAGALKVSPGIRRGKSLRPELKKNGRELLQAYLSLANVIRDKQTISPAAEWLVDNFHIVEEQLAGIKRDLPSNYYSELSKLSQGELKGYPRVYALALAFIAHTDSRLDADTLKRYLHAFQQVSPLQIGELWAVPITLRIALIEHLKPLALLIVSAREKRAAADVLADRLLELAAGSKPETLIATLKSEISGGGKFDRSFIVQLVQRLRDQDPDIWPAFDWLEKQLQIRGTNMAQLIQFEHHRQAAAQATVGNIITSMRLLSTLDWRDFFESVSAVDPLLSQDPAGAYSQMDFATRDYYRHTIERIARKSSVTELEVVHKALDLAQASKDLNPLDRRRSHIGFYLYGDGLKKFEKIFNYQPPFATRIRRWVNEFPTFVYLGSMTGLTALILYPVLAYSYAWMFFFAVIPASEFALNIFNHYVTFFIRPKLLPKMETENGIPETARTIVVIPTLFTRKNVVRNLIDHIEVQYLANQSPYIYFALLGDLGDAASETTALDAQILAEAHSGIQELNERYGNLQTPKFYVFYRRRMWNSSEEKWMGWERKRGKLLEFNRWLRGAKDTSYIDPEMDPKLAAEIKYVITLDSDTQLTRNSAQRLIGTITHPLNEPIFDPRSRRVIDGYGILQPRVSVSLVSAASSRFAQIFSGNIGLDPYTTAVSDVYQDLFAEGSFTGKGLYVVDAFEAALKNRVPENAVLSHDLFEGSYARTALTTDIELFDDYPSDFDSFIKRAHRWTRGDWQIGPWLFFRVRDAAGKKVKNDLTLIARWKIFDNLRRSLVAPMTLVCLILAWTVLPGGPLRWTLALSALLGVSILLPLLSLNLRAFFTDLRLKFEQVGLLVAFLPIQAGMQVDAILRTIYRKTVSKKRLLEWVSFAQVEEEKKNDESIFTLKRWVNRSTISILWMILLVAFVQPHALIFAVPFFLLWLSVPYLKIALRKSPQTPQRPLDYTEVRSYRHYARLTWHFFEKFLTAEDHWLAPDNFQEDPFPVVAHRTSPTNIGLQLLAVTSAYDFGYIGVHELVERLEQTFETLGKLSGLQGHLFNWYDTLTLQPLHPQYISTVDSGNLAGHLLTLKQACLEISKKPLRNSQSRLGLKDTLTVLLERTQTVEVRDLQKLDQVIYDKFLLAVQKIRGLYAEAPWAILVSRLEDINETLKSFSAENSSQVFSQCQVWAQSALKQVQGFVRDEKVSSSTDLVPRLYKIMEQCDKMVAGMNFRFLYDETRKIFVIGYNVSDNRKDNSYYDLLASESRLASFVAIAKGEVSQEHWFRLGRALTSVSGRRALIAWTATMFEYLMPLLVMKTYRRTLLDETFTSVLRRQMEYGKNHGIPWGISEAGYNARDTNLNYQYGPFGIPGLGLKRGLSDDLVVSPYSTMLAAMIDPRGGLANLRHLERMGMLSTYGFYEAVDYTKLRLPEKKKNVIIRSFMAHHQGMSLVSLNNLLHRQIMQRRFHAEPIIKATELLLQEKIPRAVEISRPRAEEVHLEYTSQFSAPAHSRFYNDVNLLSPRTQILSNGHYSVMLTSAGGGYSRCGPLSVSRWREDVTRDHWGHFFYIRNRNTAEVWSPCYQPLVGKAKNYEVRFAEDKVVFLHEKEDLLTHTEIIVSPEDDVELRRLSLTNISGADLDLDITSYMETTLAKPQDDAAHPAFSNLFVQTEFVPQGNALLATRRKRSSSEKEIWGFHVVVTEGETIGTLQYETDRLRFIGRGRSPANPVAVFDGGVLSNTVGSVLDPIFSLKTSVRIPAGTTVRVCFTTGVSESREEALRLADKYHDIHIFTRETDIAWTKSQVELRHLNILPDKADTFQRLAGKIIFSDAALRPRSHVLALNSKTQSGLWAYGISGDIPIVLMRISDEKDMAMVRELLHAHEYLRLKGLAIDLVILNERPPSYMQSLQEELQRQIRLSGAHALLDKPGGIFIRRTDIMAEADLVLFKSVARVMFSASKGTLDEQLKRRAVNIELPALLEPKTPKFKASPTLSSILNPNLSSPPQLQFFNGLGGFAQGGLSYVIYLREGQWTPAPWINVIANGKDFGFQISESGAGYTWSVNSRENRLTSWSNDAVSDPISEAIYLRDEESGEIWSPTPLPIREAEPYTITHGQGYSKFEHVSHGISQDLKVFVSLDDSVKISRLRIKNLGPSVRKISATHYVEWVLGFSRGVSAPSIITEMDTKTGTLLGRNPYNNEFANRVAFVHTSEKNRSFTCDRKEFLGRNGSLAKPEALTRKNLSGRFGAGFDPCAAVQTQIELMAGEEREIIFVLGQAENALEACRLAEFFTQKINIKTAQKKVKSYWDQTLGAIEIKTPDASMDILCNRWLLYQTKACRLWARSAFYQSGGAFGFRDQLQDVMALVYSSPGLARQHILKAAARQFEEGDVQHWWHPPTGRGVRTRFSDDLIWLPFVVSFYVKVTGDLSILQEPVHFIEAPLLEEGVDDSYQQPATSVQTATLFEHCARTLDRSLKVGAHGLPLMGSGDWNDGMSRVGHEGKGESVWVAWFLYSALEQFIPFCDSSENSERKKSYEQHLLDLKKAVEENAWDGAWYRRAYFDNGDMLGSAQNEECQIDSIAQSWSILSGAGDPERAVQAMAAVDEHLIFQKDGLIKLFTPPFDKSKMDPGYIKGYLPGVRENGGQYTHAAIWTMMAYAGLGDGDRAAELYALLNPINHAATPGRMNKYKVEPYVISADIYGLRPHVGRGGWSWYTGSASWMYRAAIESILGFDLRNNVLRMKPCIPKKWPEFQITYRSATTEYHIFVKNKVGETPLQAPSIKVDGVALDSQAIPLAEDGLTHDIHIQL